MDNKQSTIGNEQLARIKVDSSPVQNSKAKPTFKEKFEFEQLEKEMPQLQKEKATLEEKMNSGNMSYDELQKAAERISTIAQLLDEKEMRWLELSEKI